MQVLASRSDARELEESRYGWVWQRAGGGPDELVWVCPSSAPTVLTGDTSSISGVLLTGGPDVEPWRYRAQPAPGIRLGCDGARDALDLELLRRAGLGGWAVLAICYGMQLLVVAEGGTLIQDLPRAGLPGHAVPEPKDYQAHEVLVAPFARWLAPGRWLVNSRHHQAVKEVAGRLHTVAAASDGVIEAVEGIGRDRFVLGVQWHPENLDREEHVGIFRTFRRACQMVPSGRCGGP